MDPPAEIELNSKIPSTAGQSDPVKPFGWLLSDYSLSDGATYKDGFLLTSCPISSKSIRIFR